MTLLGILPPLRDDVPSRRYPQAARFSSKKVALSFGNAWRLFETIDQLIASTETSTQTLARLFHKLGGEPKLNDIAEEHRAEIAAKVWGLIEALPEDVNPLTDAVSDKTENEMTTSTKTAARKTASNSAPAKKTAAAPAATDAGSKGPDPKAFAAGVAAAKTKKAADKAKAKSDAAAARTAKKPAKSSDAAGRGRTSKLAGNTLFHSVKLDAEKNPINPRRKDSHGFRSLQIVIDAGKNGITTEDFLSKGGRMNDLNWDVSHGSVKAVAPKA